MRLASEDQLFAGILYGGCGHCPASVPPRLVPEAGFVCQGVHQPRLALGQIPDVSPRLIRERLSGLLCMLREQGFDLALGEIP